MILNENDARPWFSINNINNVFSDNNNVDNIIKIIKHFKTKHLN